jgi:uncharacterized cupredoxin-like copper-binding protein
MRRLALSATLAILSLVLTACGGAGSSSAIASDPATLTVPAATASVAQAQPTDPPPTSTQAPAATQAPATASNEVTVTLADNTITSTLTTFKVGIPYTFVITNTGRHEHSFSISQPVSVTGSLQASLSSALLDVTKEELPFGQAKTIDYTFPPAAAGKPLEFSCLIPRHYDVGMRLAITVTP